MRKKTFIQPFISFFLISLILSCTGRPTEKAKMEDDQETSRISGTEYFTSGSDNLLSWVGKKPTGQHNGTISISEGRITVKESVIVAGRVVFDMNSIIDLDIQDPGSNAKLVNHLKSPDFFYVEKYPKAIFEITSVKSFEAAEIKADEVQANYQITGNLTMRDSTKSLTFPAKIDIEDDFVLVETNNFTIDRTLWGVSHMSKSVFSEIRDRFVDDELTLSMKIKFKKSNLTFNYF